MEAIKQLILGCCSSTPDDESQGSRQPSMPLERQTQTPFLEIPAGCGGTFDMSPEEAVGYAGLSRCTAGVGFYFQVDKERYFAAHFSASSRIWKAHQPKTMEQQIPPHKYMTSVNTIQDDPEPSFEKSKTEVSRLLNDESKTQMWSQPATDRMRRSLILTGSCLMRNNREPTEQLARQVGRAVQKWLDVGVAQMQPEEASGGLVVQQRSGKIVDRDEETPDMQRWRAVRPDGLESGRWQIVLWV